MKGIINNTDKVVGNISNNNQIARNTLLLYVRMFFTMVVGLYTSRVILQVLGISDYGIYNVVGGFVSMLAYVNSSFVAATQRFLSYAVGLDDKERLRKVFCTSMTLHVFLAIFVFIVAESFGVWFVNNKLVINSERLIAANWVFQASVVSMVLNIVNIPYNSSIIAHERMNIYAYMSIFDVCSKLIIVYMLTWTNADKLIVYAFLLVVINLLVLLIYCVYCRRHFYECMYKIIIEKSLLKEMSGYAGWTAIGGIGFMFKGQGVNVVLNMFCGTVVNAARGIAMQVDGIVNQFVSNFMMAVSPQITKNYAVGNIDRTINIVHTSSRLSFYLMAIILVPLIINLKYILELWLGVVPQYTYEFLIITIIGSHIATLATPIATAINATGKIMSFQIGITIIFMLELPYAYLLLRLNYPPYYAVSFCIVTQLLALMYRYYVLSKKIKQCNLLYFVKNVVFRPFIVYATCLLLCFFIHSLLPISFGSMLLSLIYSWSITLLMIAAFGITKNERVLINKYIDKIPVVSFINRRDRKG